MPKGIVNSSDELRKLIIRRSEKYNISLLHICSRLRIDYDNFLTGYANVKDMRAGGITMYDSQIIEIAKILGIDVRTVLVVKEDVKFEEEVEQLKEQLKYEFINRKEKRTATSAK